MRALAEKGDAHAQTKLGEMYAKRTGQRGSARNYQTALKWFKLAAKQGDAHAQFNLGWIFDMALGVPENDQTAVKWYRLSAEQGHDDGQYYLAWMYENGTGVSRNYQTAVKWYRLSAQQGNSNAQYMLKKLEISIAEQKSRPTVTAQYQELPCQSKTESNAYIYYMIAF